MIGNLSSYKYVAIQQVFTSLLFIKAGDLNPVGPLTGYVEGSRAFARYRNRDEDMKKDLVKLLE